MPALAKSAGRLGRCWCWVLVALLNATVAFGATIEGTVTLDNVPAQGVEVTLMEFTVEVPVVGGWGLVVASLLLATTGVLLLLRRRSLGRWSSVGGLVLIAGASSLALVGAARSDDPISVFTDVSGHYEFTGVPVGSWGLTAYQDGFALASSSGPNAPVTGIVPVALNVSSAGATYTVNLHLATDTPTCPAAKGVGEPEPVPPDLWAKVKSSRAWAEISGAQKAGDEVRAREAQLVRLEGSDLSVIIVPMTSVALQARQSRFFVSQMDGGGGVVASYILDLTEPANAVFAEDAVVPEVIRLSTPDGRLISEARYDNGEFVEAIDGPGLPGTESCFGFAKCLLTKWKTIPGWIRRICFNKCRQCWTAPALGPCAVCGVCVVGYVAVCWCLNPCP